MSFSETDVVLLAGGFGTRLRSVISDRPKPMAAVLGRPFIEWLILQVRAQGFRRVILSTGYRADAYHDYFGDGTRLGIDLVFSHETEPLGTGGALRLALDKVRSAHVLVMNADSYARFDARRMFALMHELGAVATLACQQVDNASRYGTVTVDAAGRIESFNEKTGRVAAGTINAGVYAIKREALAALPASTVISLERDVFPKWLAAGMGAIGLSGPFVDIGTPETYAHADAILQDELAHLRLIMTNDQMRARAQAHFEQSQRVMAETAASQMDALLGAVELLVSSFRAGNKLLICGNGGSAADAQHLATEFVSRLTKDFARPALPAIALTTDTSFLTAYANDLDFDGVFDRQVEALGKPGDVLLGLSTSGSSRNVIKAMDRARRMGLRTIAIVGHGGSLPGLVDCAIEVPSRSTQHVQESTIAIYHVLCDLTERVLFA